MLKKFFKNSLIISLSEVLVQLKGLIFIPLLTNEFGPLDYGVWTQVSVLVSLFLPLTIAGTDSSFIRFVPGLKEKPSKKIFVGWLIIITLSTVIICFFYKFFHIHIFTIFFGNQKVINEYYLPAIFLIVNSVYLQAFITWYRTINNAKMLAFIKTTQAVFLTIALCLMFFTGKGVLSLVYYTLLAETTLLFIIILCFIIKNGINKPDFSYVKKFFYFGLPLIPLSYTTWGLNYADRLFLVKYCSLEDVGVYSLMYSISYIFIAIFINPIWVLYPAKAAELNNSGLRKELQQFFEKICGSMIYFTFPLVPLITIFAEPLLSIIISKEFLNNCDIIFYIIGGYILHMLGSFYLFSFELINKQYMSTIAGLITVFINVSLNFVIIPNYGIFGAAITTFIAYFLQFLFAVIFVEKNKLLQSNYLGGLKILLASFFCWQIACFLNEAINVEIVILKAILISFITLIVYVIITMFLKVVDAREIISNIKYFLQK